MQESNIQLFCTFTWLLVNESDTLFAYFSQRICYSVFDTESYMVYTFISFV